jgi:hypothetical protein
MKTAEQCVNNLPYNDVFKKTLLPLIRAKTTKPIWFKVACDPQVGTGRSRLAVLAVQTLINETIDH